MNRTKQLNTIALALDKLYSALSLIERNEAVDPDTLMVLRESIGLLENDEAHVAAEISAQYSV